MLSYSEGFFKIFQQLVWNGISDYLTLCNRKMYFNYLTNLIYGMTKSWNLYSVGHNTLITALVKHLFYLIPDLIILLR